MDMNYLTWNLPSSSMWLVEIQALANIVSAIHNRIDAYNMQMCLLMQLSGKGLCFVLKLTFHEASCSYLFTLHCGQAN